jgi:GT2 family glycosyltransferase
LAAYERCFSASGCAVVQGRVVPEFMGGRPAWLTDELAAFLGRVDEGEAAGLLRGNMNSCNMGVARGAFEAIGEFRTDLGPGGIGMAEDTEFGLRAAERGFAPVYAPDAVARHLIPPERATRRAMIRRLYHSGLSQPLFRAYRESLPRTIGYFATRSIVRLAAAAFTLTGARRMQELCGLAEHAGRVRQLIRMKRGG